MKFEQLLQKAPEGRLTHAIILSGPAGCGSDAAARELAAAYLFGRPEADRLKDCPDYDELCPPYYVSRSRTTGEDGVREHLNALSTQAFGGGRRVMVFLKADEMNEHCQNALLRTIEEPPADVLLLLVGEEKGLLTTVRSRCGSCTLLPLTEKETAALCEKAGYGAAAAKAAAVWSEGYRDRALLYCTEEYRAFRAQGAECLLAALFGGSPFIAETELLKAEPVPLEEGRKRESRNAALLLESWEQMLRFALREKIDSSLRISASPDEQKCTGRIASAFTIAQIQDMIEQVESCLSTLGESTMNAARLLDALLSRLCRQKAKK